MYTQQSTPSCAIGRVGYCPIGGGGATHTENGYRCQDSTRKKPYPHWHDTQFGLKNVSSLEQNPQKGYSL